MDYTKWEARQLPNTGAFAVYAGSKLIAGGCEEANAHLISQAPKLYEALDAIVLHFRKLDKLYSKDLEMLNLGSRALAKAGGKDA